MSRAVWIEAPFDNLPAEGFRKQRYWMMAEAFVAAGHRVVYFTSDFNHGTKRRRDALRPEGPCAGTGIEVVMVPTPPYAANVSLRRVLSHGAYARRLGRIASARLAKETPELVIAATPTPSSARVMQRVALSCGARFVIDVQDAWPETFVRLLPRPLKPLSPLLFLPWRRRVRRLYRTADLVTGVCDRYAELTGRGDYYRAYLGVCCGLKGLAPGRGGGTARPGARPFRPQRLVYLGNLGAGYDLETVLAAVARDERLTLDVAGAGPQEPALRAAVARLGLAGRVTFRGYLPDAALRALLGDCDVGVVPMRDDSWVGLPNKLGDYLAAGLRVVSSLHGECGALLEREGLGATYDFGSADSLLAALDRVAELPEKEAVLPYCLREDRIYPAYVAAVTTRLAAKTCR